MKVKSPKNFVNGIHKAVPSKKYNINLKKLGYIILFLSAISTICICGTIMIMLMSEAEIYKPYEGPKDGYYLTENNINHIYGNHIKISLNSNELLVSGHHNEIIINNNNVSKITITGLENIVYYPANSNPEIIIEGMENKAIKLEW